MKCPHCGKPDWLGKKKKYKVWKTEPVSDTLRIIHRFCLWCGEKYKVTEEVME